jgi:hypothetical protein
MKTAVEVMTALASHHARVRLLSPANQRPPEALVDGPLGDRDNIGAAT